ncbi:hypothetical protein [Shewanella aestuarii]|uniref:DUF4349 domain-containing protein n=1 Tax=Shewanella aestuarii TaxID=1028752 RepID=A0A6G9QR80_9GAMM|nr:hypothetical protein [Shewanella aestuarii]QIR16311.1 hypothetical protein HBH39_17650 [Shewanella aestuarii]
MMKIQLSMLLIVLVSGYAVAVNEPSVFNFNNESVTVQMSEHESMAKAVNRAKEIMMINAVAKTPKFVSLNTSYNSETDKIIETGMIAQGANISINNVKHSLRSVGNDVFIDATGDVTVDATAMLKKLKGERQIKLMASQIDVLKKERESIQGVLMKVKRGEAISERDSAVISQYQTAMLQSFNVINASYIRAEFKESQSVKEKVMNLYEYFVFPFLKNPRIETLLTDISALDHDVVKADVQIRIDRSVNENRHWFIPTLENGFELEDCSFFFSGCLYLLDSKGEQITPQKFYHDGKPKGRWQVHDVLSPRWCGRSIYEFLPLSTTGSFLDGADGVKQAECGVSYTWSTSASSKMLPLIDEYYRNISKEQQQWPDTSEHTAALKELSNRAFWLKVEVGRETFHLNITNPAMEYFTFSIYQPRSWFDRDIEIKTSIREEIYNVEESSWSDMAGNFLRYQNRAVIFY